MCRLSHTYLTFVLIIVLTPLWARPEYATLPRPLAVSRGTGFEDLPGRWPSPGGAGPVAGVTGQLRPSPPQTRALVAPSFPAAGGVTGQCRS